jgi:SAM-dependent methyltransferase
MNDVYVEHFIKAKELFLHNNYNESAEICLELEKIQKFKAPCRFLLAAISNAMNDPQTAYDLYYSAFNENNAVTSLLYEHNHANFNYVFSGIRPEKKYPNCPLCGKAGEPYWCYPLVGCAYSIGERFNPVRMWLICHDCLHVFASSFPEFTGPNNSGLGAWQTNEVLFSYYSKVLDDLEKYAKPSKDRGRFWLLEAGLGGCECILTAHKRGYKVFGIDIVKGIVDHAKKLGLNAEVLDFYKMDAEKKWDIIVMGDVLEHVPDPVTWIQKCSELLAENGAIWISTPDFQSRFTLEAGHHDPMRREISHLNYFSKVSLCSLLRRFGLEPVQNKESKHYNGSMEVIAVKGV